MRQPRARSPAWRNVWLALALIALLARVGTPPGTMLAQTGHGVRLVLCDGHGPMAMAPGKAMSDPRAPAQPVKAHSDGSCEFAAHAAPGLTAPALEILVGSRWAPAPVAQPVVLAVTGAGLAAPPPPSQAPPQNLV